MTLIELLTALLIVSLVLAAGYSMLHQLEHARWNSTQRRDLLEMVGARHRLVQWVAASRVRLDERAYPFIGSDGSGTSIEFLAASAPPVSHRPVALSLFVDRSSPMPMQGLTAIFREPDDTTELQTHALLPAGAMTVRYLRSDYVAPFWTREYVSVLEPPAGIEIVLAPASGDEPPRLLQLPILISTEQP